MTTLALKKLLNKLDTLSTNDNDKIRMLENSIVNGAFTILGFADDSIQSKIISIRTNIVKYIVIMHKKSFCFYIAVIQDF